MKQPHFIAVLATSLALASAIAMGASGERRGAAYKWTDRDGVTHYGDTIPPEYASQGRAELNSQGVPVREFPRQLSPAEAAVAQQQAASEARRRQHDSFLLTTYTRVADIEQLRDERLTLIEGQVEIARASLTSVQQRISTLEQRMASFKPYSASPTARRLPDPLATEAVRALSERRAMLASIASRDMEKTQLRAQFDADIARYRELTTRPAAR